MIYRCCKKT